MNIFKVILLSTFIISLVKVNAQNINWDFENGNDHGFSLWSVYPATPATDAPNIAGDEAVTGVGGPKGLPDYGCCWSIGPPNQFDMKVPAVEEGCHIDQGVLRYSNCNDPFGVFEGASPTYVNNRGQSSYLNTYNLSQWGDSLHTPENDQIATSPPVLLSEGAELTAWSFGGGSWYYRYRTDGTGTIAPEPETNRKKGYRDLSCGIAILSAQDSSFLTSIIMNGLKFVTEHSLDLSKFAGQTVIIEVVDAIDWDWGWIAIDEIQITNATLAVTDINSTPSASLTSYELMQNYPNPFKLLTNIEYHIAKISNVELKVYNSVGQLVQTLVNEQKSPGLYKVNWDAARYSSGIYYYELNAGNYKEIKKCILMK